MRVYEEPIEVRPGLVGAVEGPAAFRWRHRVWTVFEIESRVVTTGAWWDSPAATAVRSGGVDPDPEADLLDERETWRVAAGRHVDVPRGVDPELGERSGVFVLTHRLSSGEWRLAGVLD
ncbi:hypothetical protein GCM10027418_14900 [Mariniluteicoccus endophyticus]